MKLISLLCVGFCFSSFAMPQEYYSANVAIGFTPYEAIAEKICKVISTKNDDVLILASKFSSSTLKKCLIATAELGRSVKIIIDAKFLDSKSNLKVLKQLRNSGACIYSDSDHNTAHNKIIIAGKDFVFSGSYNFTDDSENLNAENGIFIRSTEINTVYRTHFLKHLDHSRLIKTFYFGQTKCSN